MKLLIAIPVMDQMEIGRISLAQWDWMTSPATNFLMIDNGSQCDWEQWLDDAHLKAPERWSYTHNGTNIGMVKSCDLAYHVALDCGYDLLAITHNDVWVFELFWDRRLIELFEIQASRRLGGVGFFGSKGCALSGHRLDTFGNVLDHGHGRRMTKPWEPACVFDGFFQCYSMEMLKSLVHVCSECKGEGSWETPTDGYVCPACKGTGEQRGGFDQRYDMMHIYDYDYSLTSIAAGWKNAVLNVPCHHLSGLTANNAAAATSGQDKMDTNIRLFHEKWDERLGVMVNDSDWSYQWGMR